MVKICKLFISINRITSVEQKRLVIFAVGFSSGLKIKNLVVNAMK